MYSIEEASVGSNKRREKKNVNNTQNEINITNITDEIFILRVTIIYIQSENTLNNLQTPILRRQHTSVHKNCFEKALIVEK